MTTTTDEYLTALPAEVKERLHDLVRIAASTTDEEKVFLMQWASATTGVALAFARTRQDAKLAELLCPVGRLLAAIYRADAPRKEA